MGHPRYHKTSHTTFSSTRWCQTYLRIDLRRNPRSVESIPGECHSRCCNLYRTCQEEDCNYNGRGIRSETSRQNTLRIWWISKKENDISKIFQNRKSILRSYFFNFIIQIFHMKIFIEIIYISPFKTIQNKRK